MVCMCVYASRFYTYFLHQVFSYLCLPTGIWEPIFYEVLPFESYHIPYMFGHHSGFYFNLSPPSTILTSKQNKETWWCYVPGVSHGAVNKKGHIRMTSWMALRVLTGVLQLFTTLLDEGVTGRWKFCSVSPRCSPGCTSPGQLAFGS